jgi:two-component system chemotaxis response regulator CheB
LAIYRILVVDDSVFMRKIISDLISEHPDFQVVGTAKNGKEAVEQVKLLKPHAITLDIEMPVLNGLDALQQIMAEQPTPTVMLSSLTQEGATETIRALELGAFDFICKPSGSVSLDLYKVKKLLHETLLFAVKSKHKFPSPNAPQRAVPKKAAKPLSGIKQPLNIPAVSQESTTQFKHLVAIGTSTGGPRALHQVIAQIPAGFPAPIVIVQHMPPNFTKSLAQRLNDISQIKVVEAQDGEILHTATAYIAPGGYHMTIHRDGVKNYKIRLSKGEPRMGHRPSVDEMFESLLDLKDIQKHIALMTGMGSDGAKSMLALRESGVPTTIAEAEESCVVYGMPRAAVELKAAMHVIVQQDIAAMLVKAVLS